ncbi:uncharacterized protein EAF02_001590 [Botrytis sinoallii]|uniref:uncharacterized protein n=1 Tax=Botrytis sinoallii TaxID=1463999 RepID=UPI001902B21C|nr:uncharacterized protein EAF02_001590 [Botrytis sinoallii]KAF7891265.1 hypothetical protein EAF02_001590 [Botrytis sinoallii]
MSPMTPSSSTPDQDANSTTRIKDLGDSTKSNHSWALVAKWLKTCREQHVSCSEKDDGDRSWCPTRLLELGNEPSGEDVVKLIETAYVKPDGDYITLSHCWGKGTLIRTLRENLQDFLIQLPSLPKTFQDAILATRMLGVRYIWIDSLCIIQDDADDWAKEASLMHKVYKNAMCNLSASASRNSYEGLFRPRAPRFLSELEIKLRNTDYDVIEEHLFDREVEDAPLQQRAWVLQERLLSPRIIHFGHSQLSWECNELCACKLFPDGLPDDLHYNGKLQLSRLIQAAVSQTELSKYNEVKFRIWDNVLQNYFKRKFTFQSDILPALSGMAKHIGNLLGDTYLAGIWKNDSTMFQLAWHCTGELSSRPDYRAPTWSWVSVDSYSAVQAARPKDSDRIDKSGKHFYCRSPSKIVDEQICSAGDDIFSHVKGGYITVEGPLNHISIRSRIGYLDEIEMEIEFDVLFDVPEELYILYLYHDDELGYSQD